MSARLRKGWSDHLEHRQQERGWLDENEMTEIVGVGLCCRLLEILAEAQHDFQPRFIAPIPVCCL